jgi:signal transduction histidine kinase
MEQTPFSPDALLRPMGEFLTERKGQIIADWLNSVASTPQLAVTKALRTEQIADDVPRLLDELTHFLTSPENVAGRVIVKTDIHAITRWEQGYTLEEFLLELGLLRSELIRHLFQFAEHIADFNAEFRSSLSRQVYAFFDRIASRSTEQFVKRQEEQLRLRLAELDQVNVELGKANDQLQKTIDLRIRLLQSIAHEQRNALSPAAMALQILEEEPDPVTSKEMLAILKRTIKGQRTLVDELADYSLLLSHRISLRTTTLSPEILFNELVAEFSLLAENKGLCFKSSFDPRLKQVTTDPLKVRQVSVNLLSNAIKYTKTGSISLTFASVDNEFWKIIVEDTGIGIPKEEIDQIFQEFHRLKGTEHIQGMGIGLTICRQIASVLGGNIKAESEAGGWSRFTLTLPKVRTPESVQDTGSI